MSILLENGSSLKLYVGKETGGQFRQLNSTWPNLT